MKLQHTSTLVPDSSYSLRSARLGFRMLREQDLPNLMKLDMDAEVRAFFPGGLSTPELIKDTICLLYTSDAADDRRGGE